MFKALTDFFGFTSKTRPYMNYTDLELLEFINEDAMNDEFNTPASREYDLRRVNVNKLYVQYVKEDV